MARRPFLFRVTALSRDQRLERQPRAAFRPSCGPGAAPNFRLGVGSQPPSRRAAGGGYRDVESSMRRRALLASPAAQGMRTMAVSPEWVAFCGATIVSATHCSVRIDELLV
jgi:hypothetical protein